MHVNIKNQICNYSINLFKSEKIETENIFIDKKTIRIWWFTLIC